MRANDMMDQSRIVSRDLNAARRFYAATCRPLGLMIIEDKDGGFAIGRAGAGVMVRVQSASVCDSDDDQPESRPCYVALEAPNDFSVRAFYRAALEAGGREHVLGYPAPQPADGRVAYYAARVADPDGNCIECGWRH
jgi:catechol 2,3-dioxygenase-like lactoylglutathione lyase family enzyme